MSIVVISDSACDLSTEFLNNNPIKLLPLNINLNGKSFIDNVGEAVRLKIYSNGSIDKDQDAATRPTSQEQIYKFFVEDIAKNHDFAIAQSISKERSPTHENLMTAARLIQRDYHNHRLDSGRAGSFGLRIINSGTMFGGQGILAAHTIKLINDGVGRNVLRQQIEEFKPFVRAFAIPKDVDYLRNRARKKGDKSIGLLSAMIGKTLDISPILRGYHDVTEPVAKVKGRKVAIEKLFQYAINRLSEGLKSPYIIVSIAGDTSELYQYQGFIKLKEMAEEYDITLMTSVMNLSGGINMGPGTICLALATENETIEF